MGFHVGIKEILVSGGVTLALLILLSIYSIALIWERWRFYSRETGGLRTFTGRLRLMIDKGNLSEAVALCKSRAGIAGGIVMASLVGPTSKEERKRRVRRAIEKASSQFQERIPTLGTIAGVAPFIGLFGTVVGVMRAFQDLAKTAGSGPGVVAVGISEALVCTATGLFVAIPAVVAYNHFNSEASRFQEEMEWISEETIEALSEKAAK